MAHSRSTPVARSIAPIWSSVGSEWLPSPNQMRLRESSHFNCHGPRLGGKGQRVSTPLSGDAGSILVARRAPLFWTLDWASGPGKSKTQNPKSKIPSANHGKNRYPSQAFLNPKSRLLSLQGAVQENKPPKAACRIGGPGLVLHLRRGQMLLQLRNEVTQ